MGTCSEASDVLQEIPDAQPLLWRSIRPMRRGPQQRRAWAMRALVRSGIPTFSHLSRSCDASTCSYIWLSRGASSEETFNVPQSERWQPGDKLDKRLHQLRACRGLWQHWCVTIKVGNPVSSRKCNSRRLRPTIAGSPQSPGYIAG